MPTPNPLPQLIPLRIQAALARLAASIWVRGEALAVEATPPTPRPIALAAARRQPRRAVGSGQAWGRLYDQRWCRLTLPADREREGGPRYLEWRDQGEATLYLGGVPYYGFDVAHRRVALPPGAREAWIECHCVQSAIWHPEATGLDAAGSVFGGAWLVRRDDDAWGAWHDLQCLAETMLLDRPEGARPEPGRQQAPLLRVPPLHRQLLRALDELCDALDRGGPAALRRRATAAYREFRQPKPALRAVLTGHAHIDLVWLWPERIGEAKAVHTFANVQRLMALYPEFRFAYSQPASYAAVARLAPALDRQVRRRIRSGRWEATGALRVESDTLLPCGEALARSFTCGQEDFTALRGGPSPLLWLPDVFGYAGCLPQLMRLAGVDYFFTTKLMWNAVNRFPLSSFVWRGTDGSEVVAHVTQDVGYNCLVTPVQLNEAARAHAQADVHRELLHPAGYGDGGGGPTEEMCERARRLDALAGLPAAAWGQPEAFFARLGRIRSQLPVWQGELYLEYHRGTYTTHGRLKAAFRRLETALQTQEAAIVVAGTAPTPALGAVWRRLIFAQFHDCIPGSSVPEVYAEVLPELGRLGAEAFAAAARTLGRRGGDACLFNPVPLARRVVHGGRLVELPPLAGVRVATAAVARWRAPTAGVRDRRLENGRVQARLDRSGGLAALTIDGETIPLAPGAGRFVLAPDRAANFEAWDLDRHVGALGRIVAGPAVIAAETDPRGLGAGLVVRRRLGTASTVALRYRLEPESPVLRIEVDLDWREPETLLKWQLATGYRGAQARCGAPFGTVLRSVQPGPSAVEAAWEIPASRHLTVTDDGGRRGLTVVSENKYGFSVRDGAIGVSLVRSPHVTGYDAGHRRAYPAALSRLRPASPCTDQGRHSIRLAVARFDAAGPRAAQPAALADLLFTPPLPYRGAPAAAPGWLGLAGGETLVPCWAQPLGRGEWTLRLHEVGGERGQARLQLAAGWTATRVDLLGRPLGAPLRGGRLPYRPHEVVGVRLRAP